MTAPATHLRPRPREVDLAPVARVPVWCGMATLRDRMDERAKAVQSLLPQVDRLTVVDGTGVGDQVKFASAWEVPGVFVSVDDDLVYPPDYVERLLDGLERYPGCIVSFHGWRAGPDGERTENYRCLGSCDEDHVVDVAGTGVMAMHTDTLRRLDIRFTPNNADLHVAVAAERAGIPRIVLAHEEGWLGYSPPATTIWDETLQRTGGPLDASGMKATLVAELVRLLYGA